MAEEGACSKLDEIDRLLNDPEVPMQAARVWDLLAQVAAPERPMSGRS